MDYTELKVDKNVPLPEGGGRKGSGLAHLLKSLAFGDSVFIPYHENQKPSSLSSNCHTASRSAGVRLTIRKWNSCLNPGCGLPSVEIVGHDKQHCVCKKPKPQPGVRVWRIDGAPNGSPTPKSKKPRV
jgi:hypothetical protein